AVVVLWWRLARHQADAQWRNAGVLLAALLALGATGAALHAINLPWPLGLTLAAAVFAGGAWALLRFDPLGRLVRDRYTSRRLRRTS
ncbi:MAG: virulence factor MviN, partial [Thiomonas sp.]|nr:virulence factor MviN [Thiomonas sp.]